MDNIAKQVELALKDWTVWSENSGISGLKDLNPMHFGWKVATEAELINLVGELTPTSKLVNIARVDNRKLALCVPEPNIAGIPIVEIMQRRPNVNDALGLDHLAFWCPESFGLEQQLKNSQIKWEHQHNEGHAWISIWFGEHNLEVKFFDHTALDIAAKELTECGDYLIRQWE